MNNKGAGEALMFFGFLFICFIIITGVALGVIGFYGKGYEARKAEAIVLQGKVLDCFYENDFFSEEFDFYSACGISEGSLESHLVYFESEGDSEKVFFEGVLDYKTQCPIGEKNENFPRCVNGAASKNGESFVYVFGSNQQSRSVSA